jgi:CRISPR/Cas system-associated endonuclease Cas1
VTVAVKSGHLVISDGMAGRRRAFRIPRIGGQLKRLIIRSNAGTISMDASAWLHDAGIPWSHVSGDGRILATSGPVRSDARLTRAQAFAMYEPHGVEVTRYLLTVKLQGQADVCRDVLRVPEAARNIDDLITEINRAALEDIRSLEACAASAYWQAWVDRVTMPFRPDDMLKIRFTGTGSPDAHHRCMITRAISAPPIRLTRCSITPTG